MNKLKRMIDEYSESHMNPVNILIHKFCVPLIMFSLLGIIKAFPVPVSWPLWFDFSHIFVLCALAYYISFKNWKVVLIMILEAIPMLLILELLRPRFLLLSLFIFIVAWIGQFIGHKIEGKKPSFIKDLQFLLIGPIWTINNSLNKRGIHII